MRTLKEESDHEQLEAAILHCEREFEKEMERLNRLHEARMRRIDLWSNLAPVACIVIFAAVLIFSIWKKNHP